MVPSRHRRSRVTSLLVPLLLYAAVGRLFGLAPVTLRRAG